MLSDGEIETAHEMIEAVEAGIVSEAELLERSLNRARLWSSTLNCFTEIWASDSDRPASMRIPGPAQTMSCSGIPIALKELFDVAGKLTTGCSIAYKDQSARQDATLVGRIRAAGLVIIGKTNQHELGAGATNLISSFGPTHNPWNPAHITGGSSGGSAAAVAAAIVPLAVGSDTGGSIRIPSSFCGVFGLKPTTGLLPTRGMMPLAPTMDCPGPIASDTEDLKILFDVLAGAPPSTSSSAPSGVRVAILDGPKTRELDHSVAEAVVAVGTALEGAGVTVDVESGEAIGELIEEARSAWSAICCSEFAHAHSQLADTRLRFKVDPTVRDWLDRGDGVTEEQLRAATARRVQIRKWFLSKLTRRSALILPTTPYPAPSIDRALADSCLTWDHSTWVPTYLDPGYFASSINLSGLPALSIPAGSTPEGLPVGVSLVGKDFGERELFELARLWEGATSYSRRIPRPSPGRVD